MQRILKRAVTKVSRAFGAERSCNLCNTSFRGSFHPLPEYYTSMLVKYHYRYKISDAETLNLKEYICPYCGCNDRDRLYALYIDKNISSDKPCKLIDFAPSQQLRRFLKAKTNIEYRSADLLMEDVDDNVDITVMSIYDNESFDFFICSHVLEHVSDDVKAMRELIRILKSTGKGILMVPIILKAQKIDEDITVTDIAERWRRFGQDDHVRCYSKQGYIDRLESVGFKVEQLGADYFGADKLKEHGIGNKSVLYIVSKS